MKTPNWDFWEKNGIEGQAEKEGLETEESINALVAEVRGEVEGL